MTDSSEFTYKGIKYHISIHGEDGAYAPVLTIYGSDLGKPQSTRYDDFAVTETKDGLIKIAKDRAENIIKDWIDQGDK